MEYKSRIPVPTALFICSVALLFDLAELLLLLVYILPFVGIAIGWLFDTILSVVAGFTLWFLFKIKGVTFGGNLKKMMASLGMFFLELTPFGILPLWTLSALWTIRLERALEKKEFAVKKAEREKRQRALEEAEVAAMAQYALTQEQMRIQEARAAAEYQNAATQIEEEEMIARQQQAAGLDGDREVEDDGRISGVMPPLHVTRPPGRNLR